MAAISASCIRFGTFSAARADNYQIIVKTPTLGWARTGNFPYIRKSRLQICAAKPETVEKVSNIVRKQLAISQETQLTPQTTFSELGADSLDTVEIVMGLEEEFDINVEEENSDNITTIQEAADLIDKLVEKK
ncbi:acyl carrier protein [Striga asiatica]|uniref:Acyl carrier protein n=1 Tax=Striga asiatica TaxID=4170 RepID=A0A5A7QJM6_STRAF|nr:acyl carrier protein [Striga asiatica]